MQKKQFLLSSLKPSRRNRHVLSVHSFSTVGDDCYSIFNPFIYSFMEQYKIHYRPRGTSRCQSAVFQDLKKYKIWRFNENIANISNFQAMIRFSTNSDSKNSNITSISRNQVFYRITPKNNQRVYRINISPLKQILQVFEIG